MQRTANLFIAPYYACLAVWIMLCAAMPAAAQTRAAESSNDDQIRSLIHGLTHENFHVRQDCEVQLLGIGIDALPQLEASRHAGESELRLRVIRIIRIIRNDYFGLQLRRFLDGQVDLPGWQLFLELQGDSPQHRRRFAEIYDAHGKLLDRYAGGEPALALLREVVEQVNESQQQQTRLDAGLAVVFSLLVHDVFTQNPEQPDVPVDFQNRDFAPIYRLVQIQQMMNNQRFGQLHRRALLAWILYDDPAIATVASRLSIAREYNLPEAVVPAVACLNHAEFRMMTGETRCDAIQILANWGDAGHLETLAQHVRDSLLVQRGSRRNTENASETYTTFVGDVALAAMIHLSPHGWADFGYDQIGQHPADQPLPFHLSGFASSAKREAARAKWVELNQLP